MAEAVGANGHFAGDRAVADLLHPCGRGGVGLGSGPTMKALPFLTFFFVALVILFGFHAYAWLRLVRDPAWPAPWNAAGTTVLACLAVFLPLSMVAGRSWLSPAIGQPVSVAAFVWLGTVFLLVTVLVGLDVVRGLGHLGLRAWSGLTGGSGFDPAWRQPLARILAVAALAITAVLAGFSLREALGEVRVKEVEVPIAGLPASLDGFTLVQLSDIHVGPTIGRGHVEKLVELTNALAPDAVVITGDLVDGTVEHLAADVAPLAALRSKHGTYFVTGNHEYYSGAEPWVRHLPSLGIRVLENERVELGGLDLAGIPDPTVLQFGGRPDLRRALAGRDATRPLVVLAHQPKQVEGAVGQGVDLLLSGHTHGGQIWPFRYLVPLQQPYVAGLHRHGGRTWVYVSRGSGTWGPPMRLGAPAELTKLVLRAAP